MKKIILLIVLLTTAVQLTAMDAPVSTFQDQSVTEQSMLNELPDEIKEKIATSLTIAEGKDDFARLLAAVKNIRALARTNKSLYALMNDPKTTNTLIKLLAQQYTRNNPIPVVAALQTTAALEWFNKFLEKTQADQPSRQLLQNTLAASLTKYPGLIIWWIADFIVDHVPGSILQMNPIMARQILIKLSETDALKMDNFRTLDFLRLEKIVNYIIASSGIDINKPIDITNRHTLFYYALNTNNVLIKILLNNPKFDVNSKDPETGQSTLSSAVNFNRLDVVKALLAHDNININAQDNNGMNALMHAMVNVKKDNKNSVEIIQLLLNRRAIEVNARDVNGETALDFLWRFSIWNSEQRQVLDPAQERVAKMLMDKGARRASEIQSRENESANGME